MGMMDIVTLRVMRAAAAGSEMIGYLSPSCVPTIWMECHLHQKWAGGKKCSYLITLFQHRESPIPRLPSEIVIAGTGNNARMQERQNNHMDLDKRQKTELTVRDAVTVD